MRPRLKVAISTLIVQPGRSGSNESYLASLVRGLASLPDSVEYVLFISAGNRELFEGLDRRFQLVAVPGAAGSRVARIAIDQLVLGRWAGQLNANVLHFPGTVGSALRLRIPQVVTVHYDLEPAHLPSISLLKRAYVNYLMRRTCRVARYVVVPSATFRAAFVKRWCVPPERVKVVYHGVQAAAGPASGSDPDHHGDDVLRRFGLEPGFLLCVTNALPHKNIPRLLDAYRLLRSRGVSQPLVLVGDIPPGKLRTWLQQGAAASICREAIILTGFLAHGDVLALYRHAGMMATPTLTESSSMPVLEAMANGCPVVASNIAVHREIAGAAVRLVDPESAEAFAGAIQEVLEDPAERDRLLAAGHGVASKFSWDRTAREMVALYAEAAGS